jgi:hypothetical protein
MNFYMTTGNMYMEPIARQLYQEIGLIEEEHVTHYESLMDPGADLRAEQGVPAPLAGDPYAMHPNPAKPAECGMNGDLQVLAGVGGGVDGSAGLGVLAGDEGTDVDDAFAFLA